MDQRTFISINNINNINISTFAPTKMISSYENAYYNILRMTRARIGHFR